MRSRVTSLESELADLTKRFTIMGQIRDKERVTLKASHVEASSRAVDLAIRLL